MIHNKYYDNYDNGDFISDYGYQADYYNDQKVDDNDQPACRKSRMHVCHLGLDQLKLS